MSFSSNNNFELNLNDEKSLKEFISRHSLIEASAGTGKTYTIIKLVEFIIKEGVATPDEILIVTFTEKAAGEIKDRLYQNFFQLLNKKEFNNFDTIKLRIENALSNINKFHINTIHGFCNYLINNYPFEIGLSFSNEIINESEIIRNSFFSYLRKDLFEDIKEVINYFEKNNIKILDNIKKLYLNINSSILNSSNNNFINFIAKELLRFISFGPYSFDFSNNEESNTEKSIKKILNYVNKISYIFPYLYKDYIFGDREEAIKYFSLLFDKLYLNLKIFDEIRKIIIKLDYEKILDLDKDEKFRITNNLLKKDLKEIYPEFKSYFDDYDRKILEIGIDKEKINGDIGGISKNYLLDFLKKLIEINVKKELTNHDFYQLIKEKIDNETKYIYFKLFLYFYFSYVDLINFFSNFLSIRVFQIAKEFKEKTNKLSFNDMIHYVFNAVNKSEIFLQTLKGKYRYCFIDEFQDTDPIQWEIFKKIFVEENKSNKINNINNRIILIGDPKQSIYYFRNADLRTYFKAKNEILSKGGYFVKLDKNFRSTDKIISVSNILFDGNYFNIENSLNLIQPYKIYKGENSVEIKINNNISEDFYKGAYFINFKNEENENEEIENNKENGNEKIENYKKNDHKLDSKTKQLLFLDFIGNEILDILENDKYLIKTKVDSDFRKIKASDIAILVSSRNDAQNIQKYLFDNYKIDSVIYKKSLLYKSDEAVQLFLLLDYISEPENIEKLRKLLFTDFFYLESINDIENFNNKKQKDKLNEKDDDIINKQISFIELNKLINENDTIINFINEVKKINKRFFQWNFISYFFKILELEKNILKRYGRVKAKNIIVTYRHIAEKLEFIAYKEKLDIFSLKNRLLSLIYSSGGDELEEDLFRNYIDDNKINILTIHASKGLEFPVVFNFAALKKANTRNDFSFYYKDDEILIEYEIVKKYKENYIDNFVIEEYRRLHYVAFTRAIFLAYTPVFLNNIENHNASNENKDKENKEEKKDKKEIQSDKKLSFSELISLDIKKLENSIIHFSKEDIKILKDKNKNIENKSIWENLEIIKVPEDYEKKVCLINQRITKLFSFSSIHRKENIKKIEDIEKILKTLEDENYKEDILLENEEDLPPGEKTGSMFHEIMEEIDYKIGYDLNKEEENRESKYKELEYLVKEKVKKYFKEYDNNQRNNFVEKTILMIKSVLDLSIIEQNFFIKDIKNEDRINELEFYIKSGNSFINGFIDLVFRKNINGETKYFIIDWKTNIIEGIGIYNHFKENYNLQALIYEYAFFKYILSTNSIYFFEYKDIEKNFELFKSEYYKIMGGIIYIYTREVVEKRDGIVFLQPDFDRFIDFVRNIENNLEEIK